MVCSSSAHFIPTIYRKAVDEQSYSGVTPKEAVREFRQFYYNCTAASLAKCNANVLQWETPRRH